MVAFPGKRRRPDRRGYGEWQKTGFSQSTSHEAPQVAHVRDADYSAN